MWKFQVKLWSIEVLALIPALGISTVANDNGPLLGYNSPSASDVSGLIYYDRMISVNNVCFVPASESNSDRSVTSSHSESVSTRNTLLAMDTRGQHIKRAVNKIGDDMRIDSSLFDPDNLWHRPTAG